MKGLLVGSLVLLAAPALHAQRLRTVPGSAPVQPVIDMASPGDRIELLGPSHPGFTVGKALDIVGVGTPRVDVPAITIEGVPRGGVCSVRGLHTDWTRVSVRNNRGTVVLRRIGADSISIIDSDRVHCETARFAPLWGDGWGMDLTRSTLTAVTSEFYGSGARIYGGTYTYAAIGMTRADLLLSDCLVHGGHGAPPWYDPTCWCVRYSQGRPGIHGDGRLWLVDGCLVSGGQTWQSSGTVRAPAHGIPGAVQTADTQVQASVEPSTITIPNQPTLDVPEEVAIGTALVATVRSDPHVAAIVFADVRSPGATDVPGLPVPFYLSATAHVAGLQVIHPQGSATFSVTIPNDPRLRFRTIFLQAVVGSLAPQRLGASAPRSAHLY